MSGISTGMICAAQTAKPQKDSPAGGTISAATTPPVNTLRVAYQVQPSLFFIYHDIILRVCIFCCCARFARDLKNTPHAHFVRFSVLSVQQVAPTHIPTNAPTQSPSTSPSVSPTGSGSCSLFTTPPADTSKPSCAEKYKDHPPTVRCCPDEHGNFNECCPADVTPEPSSAPTAAPSFSPSTAPTISPTKSPTSRQCRFHPRCIIQLGDRAKNWQNVVASAPEHWSGTFDYTTDSDTVCPTKELDLDTTIQHSDNEGLISKCKAACDEEATCRGFEIDLYKSECYLSSTCTLGSAKETSEEGRKAVWVKKPKHFEFIIKPMPNSEENVLDYPGNKAISDCSKATGACRESCNHRKLCSDGTGAKPPTLSGASCVDGVCSTILSANVNTEFRSDNVAMYVTEPVKEFPLEFVYTIAIDEDNPELPLDSCRMSTGIFLEEDLRYFKPTWTDGQVIPIAALIVDDYTHLIDAWGVRHSDGLVHFPGSGPSKLCRTLFFRLSAQRRPGFSFRLIALRFFARHDVVDRLLYPGHHTRRHVHVDRRRRRLRQVYLHEHRRV